MKTKKWITKQLEKTWDFITDYPVQFLMGACFFIGFILGVIIF